MKYTKNLRVEGNKVFSYSTHVATIEGGKLIVHGYWSTTTSKHINHVADTYGLTKVEGKPVEVTKGADKMQNLRTIAAVAMMGDIFGTNQKEKNDWKARMLKAGLENKGLIMPEDWDTLSEDEKTKRLDGVIGILTEKPGKKAKKVK